MENTYYYVNKTGLQEIRDFLAENHKQGTCFTDSMISALASEAEEGKNKYDDGSFELSGRASVTGRPISGFVSDAGFDARTEEG